MKRLPLFILAALSVVGCVDNPNNRIDRFDGPIPPCNVKLSGDAPDVDARDSDAELWQDGPWKVWNTHPDTTCNSNPTVPTRNVVEKEGEDPVEETFDMELYITYPTPEDPTKSGFGDVAKQKFPIIIFAHANNDRVCEIFESYYSLHDHWASWGWVVVSVDGTRFNCRRGTNLNIVLRAESMVSAMDRLRELNADPESRFHERLDLEHVVLAGHSRGGGAIFFAGEEIPETVGYLAIQGVDTMAFGFPKNPLTTLPTLGLTAGNDVDLNYPHVEVNEGLLAGPYAWVDITGGIHAYTADTAPLEPDDEPGVTREEQHNATELFSTALLFDALGDPRGAPLLYSLDGNFAGADVSSAGVFHRWRNDIAPVWVDTFDRADPATNALGGANSFTGLDTSTETSTYRPVENPASGRWSTSTSLWLEASGTGTFRTELTPDGGTLDVSETPVLYFKAKGPDEGPIADLEVTFVTAAGSTTVTLGEEHRGPSELANRQTQFVVPVPETEVAAIEFEVSGGGILLDDVRFDE